MSWEVEFDAVLQALQRGDESAVQQVFDLYFERLVALAQRKLPAHYAKMRDGEDVAQSVFKSFVRRAQRGDFPNLRGEGELSGLLFTMVRRRILKYIEYECRERRDQDRTVSHSQPTSSGDESAFMQFSEHDHERRLGNEMRKSDLHADLVVAEVELALKSLETDRQRQIARGILSGQPFQTIADELDVHVATVYRTYDRILDVWRQRTTA